MLRRSVVCAVLLLAAGCTGDTGDSGASLAGTASSSVAGTVSTTAGTANPVTGEPSSEEPPQVAPGIPIAAGRVEDAVGQLDTLVADILEISGIPGMSVAVVYQGSVVYAKGFGVRKVGSPEPVDADTVFQLASLSKSVGATVVAHEVTEGTVSWTDPVVTHLPSFAVVDPWVTEHVTIGDLYAHRSGLPEHAGDLLEDLGYPADEVIGRLRFLPLDPFRASYHYTNFGLTAAAEAVAAAAGTDWATLSQEALYGPLEMTSTSSRHSDFEQRANRAATHVLRDGSWVSGAIRNPDPQSPAGGVSSTVNDLAKWMTMVLNDGTGANGATIASPAALTPALTAQIISGHSAEPAERPSFYGFGFNVTTKPSGRMEVSHSGAFSAGAATNFALVPSIDLGIVTLTNAAPIGVAEALNQQFLDLVYYGEPRFDWYDLYSDALAGLSEPFGTLAGQTPPADVAPSGPAGRYVGVYANDYVGPAEVAESSGGLVLRLGFQQLEFPLTHWDGDVFTYEPSGESANPGSVSKVTFAGPDDDPAESLDIEFYQQDGSGTFRR